MRIFPQLRKQQKGSALIQAILALSILGLLIMIIQGIVSNSIKEQMFTLHKAARETLKANIENIFITNPSCRCSFANVLIPANGIAAYTSNDSDITSLEIMSADCLQVDLLELAEVDERHDGVTVDRITLGQLSVVGSSLRGVIRIESRVPNSDGFRVHDDIPIRFDTQPVGANLQITSCSPDTVPISNVQAIAAAPIYIRQSGNAFRTYNVPELNGAGRQLVLAKTNIYYADNIRIQIRDPQNIMAPQDIRSSTGQDGHITTDTLLLRIPTFNGQFLMAVDCIPGGNESPDCRQIWGNNQDQRLHLIPQAIISLPDQ